MDKVGGLYQFKQSKVSIDAGYAHRVIWATNEHLGRLNMTKLYHPVNAETVRNLWHKIGPKELVTWG